MKIVTNTKEFHVLEVQEDLENYILGELDECHSKMPAFPVVLERYKTVLGGCVRRGSVDFDEPCVVDYFRIQDSWRNRDIIIKRG